MAYRIDHIEGIGPSYARKLSEADIRTTTDLLKVCCDAKGRRLVSELTGVSEGRLLEWANMADLMRVSGIGSEYAELLEAAGVDTVKELRNRNPGSLAAKMKEVNRQRKLTRSTPSTRSVEKWVTHASRLAPMITH